MWTTQRHIWGFQRLIIKPEGGSLKMLLAYSSLESSNSVEVRWFHIWMSFALGSNSSGIHEIVGQVCLYGQNTENMQIQSVCSRFCSTSLSFQPLGLRSTPQGGQFQHILEDTQLPYWFFISKTHWALTASLLAVSEEATSCRSSLQGNNRSSGCVGVLQMQVHQVLTVASTW